MYHTLSGSPTDGVRGRTGNSYPSISWITVGFKSITVAAGEEGPDQRQNPNRKPCPYNEHQRDP